MKNLLILFLGAALGAIGVEQTTGANTPMAAEPYDPVKNPILDADTRAMIDGWPKGLPTNGVFCAVQIDRTGEKRPQPVCFVSVINTTTNYLRTFLRLPHQVLLKLDLQDPEGKPVEKTSASSQPQSWTPKQIEGWYQENDHKLKGGRCFNFWPMSYDTVNEFGIPEIFRVKQPGEYTLHLQVQLVERKLEKSGNANFQATWLPVVTAKVQIRPGDILPSRPPPPGQTNAPVK